MSNWMHLYSQFSLRELLLVVMFAGLGLASLRVGGAVASSIVFLAIVLTMGAAIVALIGRHRLRAFAVGFLAPVIIYAATIFAVGTSEFDPYEGQLPTSRALLPLFQVLSTQTWINSMTGEVVPDYEPATDLNRLGAGGGFGGAAMSFAESPDRATFMSLAHTLIALLLGYLGAKFAAAVQRYQSEREKREADSG